MGAKEGSVIMYEFSSEAGCRVWHYSANGILRCIVLGILFAFSFGAVGSHCIATSFVVSGESVSLAWDPSSDPSVGGYKVYYGTSSRNYSNNIDVGNQTTYQLSGLSDGRSYYVAVTAYTTNQMESDFSEEIVFTTVTSFTINASVGTNGSISPSGVFTVNSGANQVFTITPNPNYHVTDVMVDGVSVGAVTSYSISNITGSHTVAASFAVDTVTISASAGANGTISPSGTVNVNYGSDQPFTITADAHYHITDVMVDGVSVGAVTSYSISNITGSHTVAASFAVDTVTISASAGANGTISPSGTVTVNYGSDQPFAITADAHYHVTDVLVDGVSVGSVTSYTLPMVTGTHTIAAGFEIIKGQARLAWDASTDPDVGGYKLYYGTSSGNYSSNIDAGNQTTYQLGELVDGLTYYVAATAYNNQGQESPFSQEISFTLVNGIPSVPAQTAAAHAISSPNSISAQAYSETQGSRKATGFASVPVKEGASQNSDKEKAKSEKASSSVPLYRVLVGRGSYPKDGGWIQPVSMDGSNQSPFKIDWPEYNALSGEARIVTCDIDGDGSDEAVVGFASVPGYTGIPGGFFEILDHNYAHLAWGKVGWPDYNKANGETWPACGDIDGDGKAEIVIGLGPGGKGKVEIFSYTSRGVEHRSWAGLHWKDYNAMNGEVRPAVGDLDWDGRAEIILGLGPVPDNSSMPGGFFEVLDDTLSHLVWGKVSWPDYNKIDGETRPASGDLNGDDKHELVIGLGRKGAGRFEILDLDTLSNSISHVEWQEIPWEAYKSARGETRPVCGRISADTEESIMIGLGKGGSGYVGLFGGAFQGYTLIDTLQIPASDYNEVSGETWPAIMVERKPESVK